MRVRRAEARLRRHVAACRIQAAVRGWRVRRAWAAAKLARVRYTCTMTLDLDSRANEGCQEQGVSNNYVCRKAATLWQVYHVRYSRINLRYIHPAA